MKHLEFQIMHSPPEDSTFDSYEINLEAEDVNWDDALKELESESKAATQPKKAPVQNTKPAAPAPAAAAPPTKAPAAVSQRQRTPKPVQPAVVEQTELPRGVEYRKLKEEMLEDLQGIMMSVNRATNELQKFQTAHPYLIAPNIYEMWKDELKETSVGLMREFQRSREA